MEKKQNTNNENMFRIFEEELIWDEIVDIKYIGVEKTIDINVSNDRLFWANNILTHNSAVDQIEFNHAHIAGGISKINTADNVIGIQLTPSMRERGVINFHFLKTRTSNAVGGYLELNYNPDTLMISDIDENIKTTSVNIANNIQNNQITQTNKTNDFLKTLSSLRKN